MIKSKSNNATPGFYPDTLYRSLLGVLAAVLMLRLPDGQILLIAALLGGYYVLRSRVERLEPWLWGSLAFVTPLTGVAGGHFVLVYALIVCALASESTSPNSIKWAIPVGLLLGTWAAFEVAFAGDILLFTASAVLSSDLSLAAVRKWLLADVTGWMASVTLFAQFLVFISIFSGLRSSAQHFQFALNGLLLGLVPALGITFWQIFYSGYHSFGINEQFWKSLNRYSGSFSDPNAFGVFVPLVLPFVAYAYFTFKRHWIKALLLSVGLALIFLGFFSGSRSFFLGLATIGFLTLLRWNRPSALALLFLVFPALILLVSFSGGLVNENLPSGIVRTIHSLDLANLAEAIHSRLVFLKIGAAVFVDHIVVGIGPGNFPFVAPEYAARLGLGTGAWTDNPNNFYLGIASELGLLGVFLSVLAVCGLRFKKFSPDSFRECYFVDSLVVLLVLMLLGPHVYFMEILLVSALAASRAIVPVQERKFAPMGWLLITLVVVVAVGFGARYTERGLYFWERDGYGFFRWTHGRSYSYVNCNHEQSITLRAGHPDLEERPIQVKVYQKGVLLKEQMLGDSSPRNITLDCSEEKKSLFSNRAYFYLKLNRVWNPSEENLGDDPRLLGIKLYNRREVF